MHPHAAEKSRLHQAQPFTCAQGLPSGEAKKKKSVGRGAGDVTAAPGHRLPLGRVCRTIAQAAALDGTQTREDIRRRGERRTVAPPIKQKPSLLKAQPSAIGARCCLSMGSRLVAWLVAAQVVVILNPSSFSAQGRCPQGWYFCMADSGGTKRGAWSRTAAQQQQQPQLDVLRSLLLADRRKWPPFPDWPRRAAADVPQDGYY